MLALTITIKENLQLKNVPAELMEMLVEKLQFLNPKWLENERMGRWNRGTPSTAGLHPALDQYVSSAGC
jgi:hypothetical protein